MKTWADDVFTDDDSEALEKMYLEEAIETALIAAREDKIVFNRLKKGLEEIRRG